jgi:iron(III) transport system ATP-binding protein
VNEIATSSQAPVELGRIDAAQGDSTSGLSAGLTSADVTQPDVDRPALKSAARSNSSSRASSGFSSSGVVITGLHKGFGTHPVLHGIDLDVPEGKITAILGPSGSGKTTLLRVLAGFTRPDAGTIAIGGTPVDGPGCHVSPDARRVGYVPQEGSLFPHLDVRANIGFGVPRSRRRARTAELLELTGLAELGRRYPHELSGGQQQRVALARALAPGPSLVLLDEPFSSLDASLRTSVRLDVARILGDAGTTTVLVTHDQDEALSMADYVAVIRDGLIVQCAPPRELYARPVDAGIARFVGDANLVDGTITGDTVTTLFGSLPLYSPGTTNTGAAGRPQTGPGVVVLVRPEQVELLADTGQNQDPARTGDARGIVADCDYHGHDATVRIELGDPSRSSVVVRLASDLVPESGTPVTMRVRGAVVVWPGGEVG